MSESITCPKCQRTSHNKHDVQFAYCGVCGYHDVPEGTPHGIPGVSAKFRQPTPAMQLQALLGGFEGSFLNWVEGISSDLDLRVVYERFRSDMRELLPHIERGTWIQPRQQPEPPVGGGIL